MPRTASMTRPIDELGRICIPKEIRNVMNWDRGTVLDIVPVEEGLLIKRNEETCACCGRPAYRMMRHNSVSICEDCFSKFEPVGGDNR